MKKNLTANQNLLLSEMLLNDYHVNPEEKKGIIFDTCRRYLPDAEAQMLKNRHVEAYGDKMKEVDRFNKGDYVLFFAIMKGIIAIGKVTSKKAKDLPDEDTRYHEVDMIVPKIIPENVDVLKSIPAWQRNLLCPYMQKTFSQRRASKIIH